jgi:hypothetical protein
MRGTRHKLGRSGRQSFGIALAWRAAHALSQPDGAPIPAQIGCDSGNLTGSPRRRPRARSLQHRQGVSGGSPSW